MMDFSNDLFGLDSLEYWMTNLPSQLKSIPLIYLAIPGSHDSMTSSISRHSGLAPDAEKFIQRLRFLGPLLRIVMSRWSKTQNYDIEEQLNSGIRYFDLRLATKRGSIYPYFVHGLYSVEVVGVLNNLKNFLDKHPEEVVILDFNHFYELHRPDHGNFINLLNALFKQQLTPYSPHMKLLTLEYLNKFHYQLIVVYHSESSRHLQPNLWPGNSFPSPWPRTVSKRELIIKLNEGIANRSNNSAFVSQCVLTPTSWFVTKHLFSTLKSKCAKPLKKLKREWIQKQDVGIGGVNVVICDFIDMSNCQFIRDVILLNAKALSNTSSSTNSNLTPIDK